MTFGDGRSSDTLARSLREMPRDSAMKPRLGSAHCPKRPSFSTKLVSAREMPPFPPLPPASHTAARVSSCATVRAPTLFVEPAALQRRHSLKRAGLGSVRGAAAFVPRCTRCWAARPGLRQPAGRRTRALNHACIPSGKRLSSVWPLSHQWTAVEPTHVSAAHMPQRAAWTLGAPCSAVLLAHSDAWHTVQRCDWFAVSHRRARADGALPRVLAAGRCCVLVRKHELPHAILERDWLLQGRHCHGRADHWRPMLVLLRV